MAKAKQSKKQRKWGRNALSCASYQNANRRERNKLLRLGKHLKRFPSDKVAIEAQTFARTAVRGY